MSTVCKKSYMGKTLLEYQQATENFPQVVAITDTTNKRLTKGTKPSHHLETAGHR